MRWLLLCKRNSTATDEGIFGVNLGGFCIRVRRLYPLVIVHIWDQGIAWYGALYGSYRGQSLQLYQHGGTTMRLRRESCV
jgi:hypothetical protein